jgi:hypothetical protein
LAGCAQVPAPSHASPWQGFPSLGHDTPLTLFTIVHPPLPSHVELAWQLVGVHVCRVPPQVPALHASFEVQASPSLHEVPFAASDHAVVEIAGAHTWHAFAGFFAPPANTVPPMKQSARHEPAEHTSPVPQLVPSGRFGCAQVPAPSHASPWQGLPSLGQATPLPFSVIVQLVPLQVELCWQLVATQVKAVPAQAPAVHTSFEVHRLPSLHAVLFGRFVHCDVDVPGTHAWHAFAVLIVPGG